MAAGEDQPEAVVGFDSISREHRPLQESDLVAVSPVPAEDVYGTTPGGGHQPRAGFVGDALNGPFFKRCHQAVLHDLLGEVEIADETDEGRGQASGLLAEDGADRLACLRLGSLARQLCALCRMIDYRANFDQVAARPRP